MSETRVLTVATSIAEAEVYRRGCTIVRRGTALLEQGTSRLVIEDLPDGLDAGSISLRMPPVVTQGQVRIIREDLSMGKDDESPTKDLDEQIDELDRKIDNKQLELEAWKSLATKVGDSVAIEYLSKLPAMLDELTGVLAGLRDKRRRLAKERDELRERRLRQRLEVEVEVPQQDSYPVELWCRSNLAGWGPSYDVLVGALEEPLMVRKKGQVWQQTGDDWTDVAMRLSTGTATVMGDLPRFSARYLRKWEPQVPMKKLQAASGAFSLPSMRMAGAAAAPMEASADDTGMVGWDFDGVEALAPAEAEVSEQATVTTYELPGSQTLAQGRDPQTFVINTTELAATYHHYSYPRREEAAYLVAQLDAEPSPDMLEQPLSVYLEGSYAGTIRIGRTGDEDGYELPLGRDDRVRVRRTEDVHRSKRLLGGKVSKEHACSIVVENRKAAPLSLVLLEQVPVSRDKEIEVTLRESSGATFDEQRGELRWERTVEAGGRASFAAEYVVTHAKGVMVDEYEGSAGQSFCPRCGVPLSPGMTFCNVCGAHVG